jgi:predicted alpha/beta superfamily hydrolase
LPLLIIPILSSVYVIREGVVDLPWSGPERTAETLPPAKTFTIKSEHTGVEYLIHVQVPHEYNTNGDRYPVFFTLQAAPSGNAYDDMIAPLLRRGQIPDIIFVAITRPQTRGAAGGFFAARTANRPKVRTWADDLSFYVNPEDQSGGGADAFVAFLDEELIPIIDAEYHTDRNDRGIGGNDLGGSFAIEVSFRQPGMFERAIAIAPRVHFADYAMIDGLRSLEINQRRRPVTRLYVGAGADNYPIIVSGFELLRGALNQIETRTVNVKCELLRGRQRENELVPAAQAGLRYVYGK